MEVALQHLLSRILENVEFEIRRFECKSELLKRLPQRLAGYASWLPKNWVILVLVDRDDDDCKLLKNKLELIAAQAKLISKSASPLGTRFQIVNRIVVEELESWFFGDWQAVQTAFPKVSRSITGKSGFRDPDKISGGTWEALERIMKKAGYFSSGLRKQECARLVSQHMKPDRNKSRSFMVFCNAISAARNM